jgi:hypothetical protein
VLVREWRKAIFFFLSANASSRFCHCISYIILARAENLPPLLDTTAKYRATDKLWWRDRPSSSPQSPSTSQPLVVTRNERKIDPSGAKQQCEREGYITSAVPLEMLPWDYTSLATPAKHKIESKSQRINSVLTLPETMLTWPMSSNEFKSHSYNNVRKFERFTLLRITFCGQQDVTEEMNTSFQFRQK